MTFPANRLATLVPVLRSFGVRPGLSSGSGFFGVCPKIPLTSFDSDQFFPEWPRISFFMVFTSTSHALFGRHMLRRAFAALRHLSAHLHLCRCGGFFRAIVDAAHPAFLLHFHHSLRYFCSKKIFGMK